MVSAILTGFLVFLLLIFVKIGFVCICIYCQKARQRRQIPVALSLPSGSNRNNNNQWKLEMGLAMMELLPAFNYSASTENNRGECAVCLCGFKEQETCLLLPNCKHIFHSQCIELWFSSHSNCPLCRGNVWPIPRVGMQEEAIQITPHHRPSDEAIAIQMEND